MAYQESNCKCSQCTLSPAPRKPCANCGRALLSPTTTRAYHIFTQSPVYNWYRSVCCGDQYCIPCLRVYLANLTAGTRIGLLSLCPSAGKSLAPVEWRINPSCVKDCFPGDKKMQKKMFARMEELKKENERGVQCSACGDVVLKVEGGMMGVECRKKGVRLCELGMVTKVQAPLSEKGMIVGMETVGGVDKVSEICNRDGSDLVVCLKCDAKTCTICKKEAHNGDCPQDTDLRQILTLAVKKGWMRCGECHILFERPNSKRGEWVRCGSCSTDCCNSCGKKGFYSTKLDRFMASCRCAGFWEDKKLRIKRVFTPKKRLVERMLVEEVKTVGGKSG